MDLIDHLVGKSPWGKKRSPFWPTVRAKYLDANRRCSMCRGVKKLHVHHVESFHEHPEKELLESNLMTLCEGNKAVNCHLMFGHLGNFSSINKNARADAVIWRTKMFNRPQ